MSLFVSKQWVVTGNDPGASGGAVAKLPIAFSASPFLVIANAEYIISGKGYNTSAGGNTTTVRGDASISDYVYPYRILAIGI